MSDRATLKRTVLGSRLVERYSTGGIYLKEVAGNESYADVAGARSVKKGDD